MNQHSKASLDYTGHCPICESEARFIAVDQNYRSSLICQSCRNGSIPRERAISLVLNERFPHWRDLAITESSPVMRGVSAKFLLECKGYIPTQYFPRLPLGSMNDIFRNEDIGNMTFESGSIDIFISLDVMEHIPSPIAAHKEIWRILKPGGAMLCTWPMRKEQVIALDPRVEFMPDGTLNHLKDPEYHNNPVDESGSLVTFDYGYDIHQKIADWAPFDVRIYRFADRTHGILGEHTDLVFCQKN